MDTEFNNRIEADPNGLSLPSAHTDQPAKEAEWESHKVSSLDPNVVGQPLYSENMEENAKKTEDTAHQTLNSTDTVEKKEGGDEKKKVDEFLKKKLGLEKEQVDQMMKDGAANYFPKKGTPLSNNAGYNFSNDETLNTQTAPPPSQNEPLNEAESNTPQPSLTTKLNGKIKQLFSNFITPKEKKPKITKASIKVENKESPLIDELAPKEKNPRNDAENAIKEMSSSETVFLQTIKRVITNRNKIDNDRYSETGYLKDVLEKVNQALPDIEEFHQFLGTIVDDPSLSLEEKATKIGELPQNSLFKNYVERLIHLNQYVSIENHLSQTYGSKVGDTLLVVTQRLGKYPDLMRKILKGIPEDSEAAQTLSNGLEQVEQYLNSFNENQRKNDIPNKLTGWIMNAAISPRKTSSMHEKILEVTANRNETSAVKENLFIFVETHINQSTLLLSQIKYLEQYLKKQSEPIDPSSDTQKLEQDLDQWINKEENKHLKTLMKNNSAGNVGNILDKLQADLQSAQNALQAFVDLQSSPFDFVKEAVNGYLEKEVKQAAHSIESIKVQMASEMIPETTSEILSEKNEEDTTFTI